jgi:hypothetical protein
MGAKIVCSWQFAAGITAFADCQSAMDFFTKASHSESIAMTNNEILHADLLDILFENRTKLMERMRSEKITTTACNGHWGSH